MQPTVPEFADLLRALNDQSVRCVVIGGLAMILHGSSYVTFDLDIAVSTDGSNTLPIIQALAPLHPFPPQFGSADNFVWDERSIFGAVISLVTDAGLVDILRVQPGIDSFEGLWQRSEVREVAGLKVRVASITDLIAMKRAAGRPKDLDHIKQLEALKALQPGAIGSDS